jgi:hypothetical protein
MFLVGQHDDRRGRALARWRRVRLQRRTHGLPREPAAHRQQCRAELLYFGRPDDGHHRLAAVERRAIPNRSHSVKLFSLSHKG